MTTEFRDKDIQVCFNPHFDAVSLWLGSFGGADSPCDISRGVFAAKRGVPRLLEFFRRYGITTTWHITGHSIESFPKAAEMIAKDGHEIGVHGYSHENPLAMSPEQERDVLDKSIELCRGLTGKDPKGYATPWAEFTNITVDLLLERGFSHEFSMMEEDCFPYYLRTGDSWTKIDYTKNAADWMKPWIAGERSRHCRNSSQLALGRRTTHDVRQDRTQQSRLDHGSTARSDLDRLLRLDLPQPRLRHLPVGATPGCCSQAAPHVGAGAARRPCSAASRRQDGDPRRDGGGLPQESAVRVEQDGGRRGRTLNETARARQAGAKLTVPALAV